MGNSYVDKIFGRASIRGVADHLLFGSGTYEDGKSYEERLDEPFRRFEKAVEKYDKSPSPELLDLSNALTSETASIYAEIGMQLGIMLMKDMIANVSGELQNDCRKRNPESGIEDHPISSNSFQAEKMFEKNRESLLTEFESLSEELIKKAYLQGFQDALQAVRKELR